MSKRISFAPRRWPGWAGWGGGGVAPPLGPALPARAPFAPSNRFAPGGCNMPLSKISEAYEYLVIGLANPFALNWVPPLQLLLTDPPTPAGEIFALGRTLPLPNMSSAIHPGDGGATMPGNQQWHHISIGVTGEVVFPTGEAPDGVDRLAQSSGNFSTILKARVTLMMGNSRTRRFDVDVGAGVEIDVKCRAVVAIEALVPDPTSIPAAVPDVPAMDFAVALVTTVTTCNAPKVHRACATYSQPFFLDPTASASVALMPIMPDAKEIQLYSSDATAAAGAVAGQFIYALFHVEPGVSAAGPVVGTFSPMGAILSPAGLANTLVDVIPGNANAITVQRGAVTDNSVVNVVQILNV